MALTLRAASEWTRAEAVPTDREFWQIWLRDAGPVIGATTAAIVKPASATEPERVLLRWGVTTTLPEKMSSRTTKAEPLVTEPAGMAEVWFALRLPWDEPEDDALVVVGKVPAAAIEEAGEAAWRDRVLLWATAAGRRRRARELDVIRTRADELAAAIEFGGRVRAQENFNAAALEACNQLALRYRAERVALGWWREPYVQIVAVNQHNRVEPRMTVVSEIEAAMEEAIEQDTIILWPEVTLSGDTVKDRSNTDVCLQHRTLAKTHGWKGLCTVPLRSDGKIVGAVTLHREGDVFTQDEAEQFALALDQIGPVLAEKERRSGNVGRRMKRAAEEAMQRHANLRNPWPKLAGVALALVLAASLLIHVPYRVEAEFRVRPKQQMVFSAPFDGFVAAVHVAPGDLVEEGAPLFALEDTRLRLEEGERLADLSRYSREREQAEASGDLALMRVAEARRDQVAAQLKKLRHQIAQTVVRAPFTGTALDDGDLSERLGAPVRQGDPLLRFARMEGLYFELLVPEADAPLIEVGGPVEVAFSGQPDEIHAARVVRVEPEAVAEERGAFFVVRAEPANEQLPWWRPGMTGIAKLSTERRSLFDIFTRRLRDWLHLKLWW